MARYTYIANDENGVQSNSILLNITNVAPTSNDDINSDYEVGSEWMNTSTQRYYKLMDSTVGSAVWKDVTQTGGGSEIIVTDIVDPTANDDDTQSHFIGQRWINTVTDKSYIAVDVSTGAAIWKEITPSPGAIGGGASSMVMSFASGSSKHVSTQATQYVSLAHFIYGGSDNIGDIINFNANVWVTGNSTVCLRLYDLTNNNVIAEIIDIQSQSEANIRSMGTISNLPTQASVIEIQGQKATGPGASKLLLASIELQYE